MFSDLHLASDASDKDGYGVLEWYMNKSCSSLVAKVLHSVNEGLCKTRLLKHILEGHLEPDARTSFCGVASKMDPGCEEVSDFANACITSLAETDEDDEMGRMTLKEMRRLLRQNARKTLKQNSVLLSSASSPDANFNSESKDFDCSAQLGVLELHLDSSASNSAESGDDLSPRGVATSCHKPGDSVLTQCETMVGEDNGLELSERQWKPLVGSFPSETALSVEDDECTLQAYRQRLRSGKRSGGHAVEQSGMPVCASTKSSLSMPATASGICNMNPVVDNAEFEKPLATNGRCLSDGPLATCIPCPALREEFSEKSSLKARHGAIGEDTLIDSELNLEETVEGSEFFLSSESGKERSPSSHASSNTWVCRERNPGEDQSATNVSSWAIRLCKALDGFESPHMEEETTQSHRIIQEPIALCKMPQNSGESPVSAGGSPVLLDTHIKTDNEANGHCSVAESTVPSLQRIRFAMTSSGSADNEMVSLFHKPRSMDPVTSPVWTDSPSFVEPQRRQDADCEVTVCQTSGEEVASPPLCLLSTEIIEVAEDHQEIEQQKPSKIPCKRKAISPLSRERLLQASKSIECENATYEVDKRGLKKLPRAFKGFIGRDASNYRITDTFWKDRTDVIKESSPPEKFLLNSDDLPGSPCHNRKKVLCGKAFAPKVSLPLSDIDPTASMIAFSASLPCNPTPSCVQKLSLVLNSSPSPTLQHIPKPIHGKSPTNLSPSVPTKGILRSSSPACQGPCKCEECESLRCRAERAAEFSQRQMHDIECLAVRLLKELSAMRCVVEENLIQRSDSRVNAPHTALSSEQARRAAGNALEAEKMAKSWLIRMARDCNRYCKIMRMQERKLTFADESGGQLCQIKVFHSQSKPQKDNMLSNPATEIMAASLSCNGDLCSSETELDITG